MIIAAAVILAVLTVLFLIYQDNFITVSHSYFYDSDIPPEFDGFKILQVSDLHNKRFGKSQARIIEKIKAESPDMIVISGDLIDRRRFNFTPAAEFTHKAAKIAPVYYVFGNHEAWSADFNRDKIKLTEQLKSDGVNIINNADSTVSKGRDEIKICGFLPDYITADGVKITDVDGARRYLEGFAKYGGFKILISHRPELINIYSEYNMNLIFSGHAHGGQFRLPFIGGLFAPNQGLFPKYTSGRHRLGRSVMYVSRGLGNSRMPIRLFNRPELISVTLKTDKNN